jgi:hypothetical protein
VSLEDDLDELPERHGPFEDPSFGLNRLFAVGFTVPMSLRMNSVYGKYAPRTTEEASRLLKVMDDEIRIIRGEARVT